jgi:hypothetical protein
MVASGAAIVTLNTIGMVVVAALAVIEARLSRTVDSTSRLSAGRDGPSA